MDSFGISGSQVGSARPVAAAPPQVTQTVAQRVRQRQANVPQSRQPLVSRLRSETKAAAAVAGASTNLQMLEQGMQNVNVFEGANQLVSGAGHMSSAPVAELSAVDNASETPSTNRSNSTLGEVEPGNQIAAMTTAQFANKKPTGMKRAKQWTLEVENIFRFQAAGFRDIHEYITSNIGGCEFWPESGFLRQAVNKKSGYHMYFRRTRECQDKYLNKIKLYSYE